MAKILVVDDDVIFIKLISRMLVREGYEVVSANDSDAGVALAESAQPNLILMDVWMRSIYEGFDATRRVRTIPSLVKTPVIAMTAHAGDADRQAATDAGCNDLIAKPITDIDSFLVKVKHWAGVVLS